jgi:hypothetical protein
LVILIVVIESIEVRRAHGDGALLHGRYNLQDTQYGYGSMDYGLCLWASGQVLADGDAPTTTSPTTRSALGPSLHIYELLGL